MGEFTRRFAYGGFVADTKTVYAVVRALEIVSEATRKLPRFLRVTPSVAVGLMARLWSIDVVSLLP